MKRNKNTIVEPELFVDDHHGIYMGRIAYQQLNSYYMDQAKKQLSQDDIDSLNEGPDNEFYDESCDNLTNVTFKTPTGQKFNIQYAEGGMWLIPACFMRSKAANEFFGN